MSIVIRSDEVNVLVYKYLQESNLTHTAFTFYNEAALADSITRYRYDLRAGHLLSLLEKALIFCQIESHTTISEYEECREDIHLLKPHICSIVQRVKEDNQKLMEEFNEQIYTSMRRTSSIHHTLVPNKQFQEIVWDQKHKTYLDRVPFKLPNVADQEVMMRANNSYIVIYENHKHSMAVLKKQQHSLTLHSVLPSLIEQKLAPISTFQIINQHIYRIYQGNICEIIAIQDDHCEVKQKLRIPLPSQIIRVKANERAPGLLLFQSENGYCVVHMLKGENICSGDGKFQWRILDQYILSLSQALTLNSLKQKQPLINYVSYCTNVSSLRVSPSKIYFFAQSLSQNQVVVYTFDKEQPLYIINLTHNDEDMNGQASNVGESEHLQQTLWVCGNSFDYLIMLTNLNIRVFEIELNNYAKIVEIEKYDKSITQIEYLRKENNEAYIIGRGVENLIVFDVCQGKIERILRNKSPEYEHHSNEYQMYALNDHQEIGLRTGGNIYFVRDHDLEDLFK